MLIEATAAKPQQPLFPVIKTKRNGGCISGAGG